jgi:Resolvase, N terminal domain
MFRDAGTSFSTWTWERGPEPASGLQERVGVLLGGRVPEDARSRLRTGDTLVVSKLDRMGRDMREIMETAWSLLDLGAKLEILSGPLAGGRRADGESVTSIAKRLTYKTASGEERTGIPPR